MVKIYLKNTHKILKVIVLVATLLFLNQYFFNDSANALDLESLEKLHKSNYCVNFLLEKCDLSDAQLSNMFLRDAELSGANLEGANFSGTNLGGANLILANLKGANFSGAILDGTNSGGANLEGANLSETKLWGTDFGGANLKDANLSGADLSGTDLEGAKLEGAILVKAKLNSASIKYTNFSNANLTGASFKNMDCGGHGIGYSCSKERYLVDGNFKNTNFSDARLMGVDFGVSNLEGANFINAVLDETTFGKGMAIDNATMPDGTIVPASKKSWYKSIMGDHTKYDEYVKKIDSDSYYYDSSCRQDVKNDKIKKDLKYKDANAKYSIVPSCQKYRNLEGAYKAIKGEWKEVNTGIYENIRGHYEFVIQD